jgi:hypothetical protein
VTCYRMSDRGEQPVMSVGRARGRRNVRVCGPATIPAARDPREPLLGFSELSSREKVKLLLSTPLKKVRK